MDRSTDEKDLARRFLLSPPSGAESLFMGAAATMLKTFGPNSIGQYNNNSPPQRHINGRIRKQGSFYTAETPGSNFSVDEFVSCVENASDMDSIDSSNSHLALHTSRICMETIHGNSDSNNKMAKKNKTTSKTAKKVVVVQDKASTIEKEHFASVVTPEKEPAEIVVTTSEKMKVDAAEVVYGKAKDILLWGKSVPVVSFLVGTSEEVAGKALGVIGTDLTQLDGKIESELSKLDTGILNPAIEAVAKILIDVAGKSEETIKPIVSLFLKPLGMLIKSEKNEQSP